MLAFVTTLFGTMLVLVLPTPPVLPTSSIPPMPLPPLRPAADLIGLQRVLYQDCNHSMHPRLRDSMELW